MASNRSSLHFNAGEFLKKPIMAATGLQDADLKKWSDSFDVDIAFHEHSGRFFINFSKDGKCLISVKVTEPVAVGVAKDLGLRISK